MRPIDIPWPRCRRVVAVARNFAVLVAGIAVATILALSACSDPLQFAEAWDVRGSVAFTSSSADSVLAEMVIVNRAPVTLQVHGYAHCPSMVDVEVRRDTGSEGAGGWSYRRDGGYGNICAAMLVSPVDVAPGDSVAYRVDFPVSAVLGDTLSAGSYDFTGVMLGLGATDVGTYRTGELGMLSLGLGPGGSALRTPAVAGSDAYPLIPAPPIVRIRSASRWGTSLPM